MIYPSGRLNSIMYYASPAVIKAVSGLLNLFIVNTNEKIDGVLSQDHSQSVKSIIRK